MRSVLEPQNPHKVDKIFKFHHFGRICLELFPSKKQSKMTSFTLKRKPSGRTPTDDENLEFLDAKEISTNRFFFRIIYTWIFQVCKIYAFSAKKPAKRQKFHISRRSRYISLYFKAKHHQAQSEHPSANWELIYDHVTRLNRPLSGRKEHKQLKNGKVILPRKLTKPLWRMITVDGSEIPNNHLECIKPCK